MTVDSNNSYLSVVENYRYENIKNMKIAYAKEFFEGIDEKIKNIILDKIGILESQGAKIEQVSLPNIKYVIPIYYLIVFSEFSSAMSKFDDLNMVIIFQARHSRSCFQY